MVFSLLLLRTGRSRPLRFCAAAALSSICLFAIYQCQRSFNNALYGTISTHSILVVRIVLAATALLAILRWPRRALPGLRTFFLVLSPLFIVFLVQGVVSYYGSASARGASQVAGMLPDGISRYRVIWVLFDELDYRLLFEARPDRIQLPHFDALRRSSLFADHVESPAPNTTTSLPSLLLAKTIPENEDINLASRPVRVRFEGCSQFVPITQQQNVFRQARDLGFDTAVSGWYHAYCRMFGSDLSACATSAGTGMALIPQKLLRDQPFLYKAAFLANWQARSLPLAQRLQWISTMPDQSRYAREMHIMQTRFAVGRGIAMLRDRNLDFVLLHLPVPHPPGIWDGNTRSFSTSPQLNYVDNLVLADRTLGEIRRVLEKNGDWDQSIVLVSSDHPYRPNLWLTGPTATLLSKPAFSEMTQDTRLTRQPYIPFFFKLPGQKTGIDYHRPFNSVLSANLLLAALQGQIRTPAEAVRWLDMHAAASEAQVCR